MQVMDSARAKRAAGRREGKNRLKGQGHPATADLYYTDREWEFMQAIEAWKKANGRPFPTWCDVLRVVDSLGYEKRFPAEVFDAPIAA